MPLLVTCECVHLFPSLLEIGGRASSSCVHPASQVSLDTLMALYTYPAHRLFAECNSMDLNIHTVPKGRESLEDVQSGMGESMKREEPRVFAVIP